MADSEKLEQSQQSKRSEISVVVIDDDANLREILMSWLNEADGCVCVGAFPDAETAVRALPKLSPEVALVDINLPRASGIDCVSKLKPLMPKTQFVMLTVYEDSESIFAALQSGATGYLLKRTIREDLLASIAEVNAGGSPMTGNIARKVVQSLQRAKPKRDPADELSKRENEVLLLLAQGYLYKEIAEALGISFQTVNTHVRRIYEKLHVHSRSQAVALFTNLPGEADL